ncbi:hypothetical protein FACS18945_4690 [Bacteroidia bacterium]|nr:hypothetical protein FACS18945_4690 [Bacteroidia bacterium]
MSDVMDIDVCEEIYSSTHTLEQNLPYAERLSIERGYNDFLQNKLHTHKEVFSKLLDKLSLHYNVNMHELVEL